MDFVVRGHKTAPHCLQYIGVYDISCMACALLVAWGRVITDGQHRYGQVMSQGRIKVYNMDANL